MIPQNRQCLVEGVMMSLLISPTTSDGLAYVSSWINNAAAASTDQRVMTLAMRYHTKGSAPVRDVCGRFASQPFKAPLARGKRLLSGTSSSVLRSIYPYRAYEPVLYDSPSSKRSVMYSARCLSAWLTLPNNFRRRRQ